MTSFSKSVCPKAEEITRNHKNSEKKKLGKSFYWSESSNDAFFMPRDAFQRCN